jgi:hypothetical protein
LPSEVTPTTVTGERDEPSVMELNMGRECKWVLALVAPRPIVKD